MTFYCSSEEVILFNLPTLKGRKSLLFYLSQQKDNLVIGIERPCRCLGINLLVKTLAFVEDQ